MPITDRIDEHPFNTKSCQHWRQNLGEKSMMNARSAWMSLGLALILIVDIGCSIRSERVTAKNSERILLRIGKDRGSLSEEERRLFRAYIIRSRLIGVPGVTPPPLDLTVDEIIDRQRTFELEQPIVELERAVDAVARLQQLQLEADPANRVEIDAQIRAIDVEEADMMHGRPESRLNLRVNFTNRGSRAIREVRGAFAFRDTSREVVARVEASVEQNINARASFDTVINRRYDPSRADDRALRSFDLTRGRVEWEPERVVFADGTRVQLSVRATKQP